MSYQEAQNDISAIVLYIKNKLKNPSAAQRLFKLLRSNIMQLDSMPERYAPVRDTSLAEKGIRKLIVENHLIFFYIDEVEHKVSVLRILYDRRDWKNLV
ncbi:MAG: type II toxin-antitoxin system RelE/ParE family toxin [Candidatus Delongbacteria bacterium]|nr:type II toxin-antitoxin system RelE/ParE family toxin [Candidatus Delongbacteria bacterium]